MKSASGIGLSIFAARVQHRTPPQRNQPRRSTITNPRATTP
jgi:hypothetical protein